MVTTAGGVEEDLIKCLSPTYKGNFSLPGTHLRSKGLNRIGNLLVPNDNYCKFEDWIISMFDQTLEEAKVKVFRSIFYYGCVHILRLVYPEQSQCIIDYFTASCLFSCKFLALPS